MSADEAAMYSIQSVRAAAAINMKDSFSGSEKNAQLGWIDPKIRDETYGRYNADESVLLSKNVWNAAEKGKYPYILLQLFLFDFK